MYFGVGVGEDISFDTELLSMRKYTAILVDPTLRSLNHVQTFLHATSESDDWRPGVYNMHGSQDVRSYFVENHLKSRIHFVNKALWLNNRGLRLQKPKNANFVSYFHPVLNSKNVEYSAEEFATISLEELKIYMHKQTPERNLVIVKMDIEGCEVDILLMQSQTIGECEQVLIEFDFLRSSNLLLNLITFLRINVIMRQRKFRLACTEGHNYLFLKDEDGGLK
jgi:FkbM family methyltransferase